MIKYCLNVILVCLSVSSQAHTPKTNACSSLLIRANLKNRITPAEAEVINALETAVLKPKEFEQRSVDLLDRFDTLLSDPNFTPSIAHHAAMSHLYLTGILKTVDLHESLKDLLIQVTTRITGTKPRPDQIGKPLKRKYLKNVKPDILVFYNASFRDVEGRGNADSWSEIFRSFNSTNHITFSLTLTALTATAFYNLGSEYIAAALMGLLITTVSEYVFHRVASHADPKLFKLPLIGRLIRRIQFNHDVIHHGVTFNNYVTQFDSQEHKDKVDNFIDKVADREDRSEFYKYNLRVNNRYGLVLNTLDYLSMVLPVAVPTALVSYFLGFDHLTTVLVSTPSLFYPLGVNLTHTYNHTARTEIKSDTKNRPLLRRFLKTRFVALMAQVHYVHHEKPKTNFNLFFLFADAVMGTLKLPTLKDIAEIRDFDGLGTTWGENSLD